MVSKEISFESYASAVSTVRSVFDDWMRIPFEQMECIGLFIWWCSLNQKCDVSGWYTADSTCKCFMENMLGDYMFVRVDTEAYGTRIILNVTMIFIHRLATDAAYL